MAFTLSSIGDSYTAFCYNSGTEFPWVNTLWGDLRLFGVAEGFAGAFGPGNNLIGLGDNRKGHVKNADPHLDGVFSRELTGHLPTAYPYYKLSDAAIGGTRAQDWAGYIPNPYVTNGPGHWAGFTTQLDSAKNNKPVVFFTLGGNDILYKIRTNSTYRLNDNAYFDGTLMPQVEQYLKEIIDYIMWLTGGNPTAGLPGSAEIVMASYPNFSVQDYDGSSVTNFFYTSSDITGNWHNAIWCAENIGAYKEFYHGANGGNPGEEIYGATDATATDAIHLMADIIWQDKGWGPVVNRYQAFNLSRPYDPFYYNPYYPWNVNKGPWELAQQAKPLIIQLLNGPLWQYNTNNAGPWGPAGTRINGWGFAVKNITDVSINTLFRKLDTVYQNIEAWAETKYRHNAVIYCPVWKAVANPLKPNTPVEYRSWPRNLFNDAVHLNQDGWNLWTDAIFNQWFPRSTYIPQLNTVSTFSGFMY